MNVKYIADIETPTDYFGYLVDGSIHVTIGSGSRGEKSVDEWIADGNTPEEAFTQEELDAYALTSSEAQATNAINNIVVAYDVEGVTYNFGGGLEAQNRINVGITKAKSRNKNQQWITADRQKVMVTPTDLQNIMDLIDVQMEAILDMAQL